jgi:hypothetical protein
MSIFDKLSQKITKTRDFLTDNLPLVLVIVIALIIAVTNIDFGTYYTGWDNIHAELNLIQYARQVFFGSWMEHQGLGAPAAQSHAAEIPRLPFLFILKLILPDNLVRYVFIFTMYLVGGIGTYFYLDKIWLKKTKSFYCEWVASLGAIFYLLHIFTVQQFYISFEMFTVQFAFIPFILLSIHQLDSSFSNKHLLQFIALQLLIAPSSHTATVFYLGVLFYLLYAFFLKIKKGFCRAFAFSFIIGLITLVVNIYWILPNVYYSLHNAHYVAESRTNRLFNMESIWSIRDSSNLKNFVSNMHYIFQWKDYSFADYKFEFIFQEWQAHLTKPFVSVALFLIGFFPHYGLIASFFDREQKSKRWAIVIFYLFCVAFIWIDLFPTKHIFNYLYQNPSFLEAFRNPVTKLSILYTFVSVILFAEYLYIFFRAIEHKNSNKKTLFKGKNFITATIVLVFVSIIYISLPAFKGQFISEKLEAQIPEPYWQMFDYLQTRDKNLRILQLPQFSHAGWLYHDWTFLGEGNGYQGMGFTFFGIPQPTLSRDSDRWVETSDFFFHELKYALATRDIAHFKQLTAKYNVDLILVDETKLNTTTPYRHNFQTDHGLAQVSGFEKIWEQDFLTIYERKQKDKTSALLTPENLSSVRAELDRVKKDFVYQNEQDYVKLEGEDSVSYPFANLLKEEYDHIEFSKGKLEIKQTIDRGKYQLTLPSFVSGIYRTPAEIRFKDNIISVKFPRQFLKFKDKTKTLPRLKDFSLAVEAEKDSVILLFNDRGIVVNRNQTIYPIIQLNPEEPVVVNYAQYGDGVGINQDGQVSLSDLEVFEGFVFDIDWSKWNQDLDWIIESDGDDLLVIEAQFPRLRADLTAHYSENCSQPKRGTTETKYTEDGVIYKSDNFGVNCNFYDFEEISSAYSYVLHVKGENYSGRSIKFFVRYPERDIVSEEYRFPRGEYNRYYTLSKVSSNLREKYVFNWENRSFGGPAVNRLELIELMPLPLNNFSQLKLKPVGANYQLDNQIKVLFDRDIFDFLHLVKYQCHSEACYLGLDQSYDDLWLAFTRSQGLLPHYRLNNWANLWQVTGEGDVVIVYLPELVSILSLIGISFGGLILIIITIRQPKKKILEFFNRSSD